MKKHMSTIIATSLALLLAVGLAARINAERKKFDKTVTDALKTSEGYDQRFIDMVNNLEHELALRASFGYAGQKDPMTGKERMVVRPVITAQPRRPSAPGAPAPAPVVADQDRVKLTAIIFDDAKKVFTAIVMDDERSFAVEVGDKVAGRNITKITNDRIFMEDDSSFYFYDITGRKGKKFREGKEPATVPPPQSSVK